jgi:nitrate reductase NapAB chaperone NapD
MGWFAYPATRMGPTEAPTYLSGLVVRTTPDRFDDVLAALGMLPGVSVHQTDAATARVVVVQEAPTLGAEMDGMRRIQTLPGVVDASLVYHYLGDGEDAATAPSRIGAGANGLQFTESPSSESQRETER